MLRRGQENDLCKLKSHATSCSQNQFFLLVQYSLTTDQLRLLTVLYSTRNCDPFFWDMHHLFLNWKLHCAWKNSKTQYAWVFGIFMTWSKLHVHVIYLCNGLFWCFCIDMVHTLNRLQHYSFTKKSLNFKVLKLMLELCWSK